MVEDQAQAPDRASSAPPPSVATWPRASPPTLQAPASPPTAPTSKSTTTYEPTTKSKKTYKNLLLQIRPAFGGNIIATIVNPDRWPQMATVREGVIRHARTANPGRKGEIIRMSPSKLTVDLDLRPGIPRTPSRAPRRSTSRAARVIIAGGGRGRQQRKLPPHLGPRQRPRRRRRSFPRRRGQRLGRQGSPGRPDRHHRPPGPLHRRAASPAPSSTAPAWTESAKILAINNDPQKRRSSPSPTTASSAIMNTT